MVISRDAIDAWLDPALTDPRGAQLLAVTEADQLERTPSRPTSTACRTTIPLLSNDRRRATAACSRAAGHFDLSRDDSDHAGRHAARTGPAAYRCAGRQNSILSRPRRRWARTRRISSCSPSGCRAAARRVPSISRGGPRAAGFAVPPAQLAKPGSLHRSASSASVGTDRLFGRRPKRWGSGACRTRPDRSQPASSACIPVASAGRRNVQDLAELLGADRGPAVAGRAPEMPSQRGLKIRLALGGAPGITVVDLQAPTMGYRLPRPPCQAEDLRTAIGPVRSGLRGWVILRRRRL